jgi:hypothetical protein
MTTAADIPASFAKPNWFERSEGWLDRKGKGAWIGATVLGLIFFWPVGLALLAYMIWSKKCSHPLAILIVVHTVFIGRPAEIRPLMPIAWIRWTVWHKNKKISKSL